MMIFFKRAFGREGFELRSRLPWLRLLALLTAALLSSMARAQTSVHATASQIAYDTGETVKVRVFFGPSRFPSRAVRIVAAVRYDGSKQDIAPDTVLFSMFTLSAQPTTTPYASLWRVPDDATTGRYEVSLKLEDANSRQVLSEVQDACSFAVFKKLVEVQSFSLNSDIFSSNDPLTSSITLKNMTGHRLAHLRVEFSGRYWPWIAGPAAAAAASIVPIAKDLTLGPGEQRKIVSPNVAVAPHVNAPEVHQYGVVVWDEKRESVLAISFSPLAFIFPPGMSLPKPYPRQYVYPLLKDVNAESYKHFYPPTLDSGAIAIDASRTMYTPGSTAVLNFSVQNPTPQPWKHVTLAAQLLGPDGAEIGRTIISEDLVLAPESAPLDEHASFPLPQGKAGVYKARVSVEDSGGNALASNVLELGVNELPKSILIFCAHEDDEGGWMPLIRAAVENHIPIHVAYFTSGDAGSCDVYYEHSCSPADALNFGALRMEETRTTLGHLGLPSADIDFLGLPDGGSGEIWYDHPNSRNPFLDPLLACDHAPYAGLVQPNLAFARDAVLGAARELIQKYNPQVIVTAHPPSQGHIDHIVNGYIVIKALQELVKEGAISPEQIKVLVDRVYDPKTAPFTPYHYADHTFYVSGEVATLDQEAGWFYQSQGGDIELGRIRDFGQLRRKDQYREILDWLDYQGWNTTRHSRAATSQEGR